MKCRLPQWISIALLIVSLTAFTAFGDLVDEYNQAKKYLGTESLYRLAVEKIETGEDEKVVAEALKDAIRYSLVLKMPPRETLRPIEDLLRRVDKKSELYGRASLAKARLWMRDGQISRAMKLMKRGVLERWKENAFHDINQGLLEIGREDLCAIDEYNRNTTTDYSPELREFYGIGSDLFYFYDRLRVMRMKHPDWFAMKTVFPHLKVSSWRPFALPCAMALCLAADERYQESLDILLPLEETIAEFHVMGTYNESKDFPLVLAVVLLMEGRDFDAMRAAFQNYIERNRDNPVKIMNRASDVIYTVSKSDADKEKMVELTGFLLQSDLVTHEETRKLFSDDILSSLHDKHMMGLVFCGRGEESAQWAKTGMERYFPHTFPGTNCALNYAGHLSGQGKQEEAKKILYSIIQDTSYATLINWARLSLAHIELLHGKKNEALNHLRAIEEKVSPQDTGVSAVCLQRAVELKKRILAERQ